MTELPTSVDATDALLRSGSYLANRSLSTALYLSLSLKSLLLQLPARILRRQGQV